jgi:predicted pyridoxine 5'-phosphate oxidase superfamily flavin-nucleotide-binding protein
MALITEEMQRIIEKMKPPVVATSDIHGKPNVVPIGFTKVISDSEILLMDNYMNKTRKNIESNPQVSISVWSMEDQIGYQFKGKARIETSGPIFDNGIKWVKSRRPQTDPRAAIIVKIEEIYLIGSDEKAGKRVA